MLKPKTSQVTMYVCGYNIVTGSCYGRNMRDDT